MPHWRPKRFTTQERLRIADIVLTELEKRYSTALQYVALEGSTAKGLDKPESDLEFRVVIDVEQNHRWYPFFYKGMFVGISFVTLPTILEDAKNVSYTWPLESDALWTAKVLYDPSNLYERLCNVAKYAEENADFAALARASLADMYEHVYKIFTIDNQNILTASHEARSIALWAVNTVGLVNRFRYLSSRTMHADSMNLDSLPNGYVKHLTGLLAMNTDIESLQHHASQLWSSFAEWSSENHISLDDDELMGL